MSTKSAVRLTWRLRASLILVPLLGAACAPSGNDTSFPTPEVPTSQMPASREIVAADRIDEETRHVDPRLEGWNTEAFNEEAGGRLYELSHLLDHPEKIDTDAVAPLITEDFECDRLRPVERRDAYSGPALSVRTGKANGKPRSGADALVESLLAIAEPFTAPAHAKTKVISVDVVDETTIRTRVLAQFWGDTASGPLQQNSTWNVTWRIAPDAKPLIRAIRLEEYEENSGSAPLFTDCTASAIGHERAYTEQLLRGTDDWCARIDFAARMNQYGHNGLAIGDIDNDRLEDVYILQSGGLPNRLFRQNPDGSATDVSAAAGVDWLNESRGALFVDLDNDGNQDLVLTTMRGVLILRGDGQGKFDLAGELPTTEGYSIAAADVDGDTLLDLYVCNYLQTQGGAALPAPYHDARNGPPNVFYRNVGGLQFEDATAAVGLDADNNRFSYAATWVDHDDDGDLDLYVANDFGRNNLYRNDGGRFTDVAGAAGVEDMAAGMGTSWSDYDGDGDLDLYVSNMFSSAGRRITYQRQFHTAPGVDVGAFQRHARGNSLFANQGDGTFRDVTLDAGVWMGRWAWGAEFVDLNDDGLDDIYVPNGFLTNEDTKDL
jgi:hypothetical protein